MSIVKKKAGAEDEVLRLSEVKAGEKSYVEFHVTGSVNVASFYIDGSGVDSINLGDVKYDAKVFKAKKAIEYISCASASDPAIFTSFDAHNFAQIAVVDQQQKIKANFIADSQESFESALNND